MEKVELYSPPQRKDGGVGVVASAPVAPHSIPTPPPEPKQADDKCDNNVEGDVASTGPPSVFKDLPPEIISIIAGYVREVGFESLKAFRSVNQRCAAAGTQLLFRNLTLRLRDESIATFDALPHNDRVRSCVQNLTIDTAEYTDTCMDTFDWDDQDHALLESFKSSLSRRIGALSKLRHVHIRFSKDCVGPQIRRHWWARQVPECVDFRSNILRCLFLGLNNSAWPTPNLHSLSIENLQDWDDWQLSHVHAFSAVMGRVRKLELQITTEDDETDPMRNIEAKELHDFYGTQLQQNWLRPCAANLTHLKLYARTMYWGYIPKCTLPHFPKLKSLSLGMLSFFQSQQLEWILSHAGTLEELTLDNCPIVIASSVSGLVDDTSHYPLDPRSFVPAERTAADANIRNYASRWHHYFDLFAKTLAHLRVFRCGYGDWDDGAAFTASAQLEAVLWPERYRIFDTFEFTRPPLERGGLYDGLWEDGDGLPVYPDCTAEDLVALVGLREVLATRSGREDEQLRILREAIS